ncbi:hypothetical protein FOZ63_029706 [Perkinsus olseni]|uniref:Uncharacterized protein n=1 Tax=Perkinsus olseni TaxID=32597 RepID=A0A7J6RIT9_PEROL|nr:hypothetical protein FOZ63_029706 [Perkinsus olseni]
MHKYVLEGTRLGLVLTLGFTNSKACSMLLSRIVVVFLLAVVMITDFYEVEAAEVNSVHVGFEKFLDSLKSKKGIARNAAASKYFNPHAVHAHHRSRRFPSFSGRERVLRALESHVAA